MITPPLPSLSVLPVSQAPANPSAGSPPVAPSGGDQQSAFAKLLQQRQNAAPAPKADAGKPAPETPKPTEAKGQPSPQEGAPPTPGNGKAEPRGTAKAEAATKRAGAGKKGDAAAEPAEALAADTEHPGKARKTEPASTDLLPPPGLPTPPVPTRPEVLAASAAAARPAATGEDASRIDVLRGAVAPAAAQTVTPAGDAVAGAQKETGFALPAAVSAGAASQARASQQADPALARAVEAVDTADADASEPLLPDSDLPGATSTAPRTPFERERTLVANAAHATGVPPPVATEPRASDALKGLAALTDREPQRLVGGAGDVGEASALVHAGALNNNAAPLPQVSDAGPLIALQTPVQAPEFREALATQVSMLAKDGVQQASLQLNPAHMGPISVQISMDGTQARVDFAVDSAATRQIVEAGLPELASALRDAGLTLSGGGVSQQSSQSAQQEASARQGGQPGGTRQGRGGSDEGAPPPPPRRNVTLSPGGLDLYA
jgi:flagellar hook-length control protein FliK